MPENVFHKRDTPIKRALIEALTATDKTGLHETTVSMILDKATEVDPNTSRNSYQGQLGNLVRERLITIVPTAEPTDHTESSNIPAKARHLTGSTTIATSSDQRRNLVEIVRNWDRARVRSVAR